MAVIESYEVAGTFDYAFKEPLSERDVGKYVAASVEAVIEQNPMEPFVLSPGDYTVYLSTRARFVRR